MDYSKLAIDAKNLSENYGYWKEHPDHPVLEWKEEVASGETRLGYWEWVVAINSEDAVR
jgi:hypothetical protein